MSLHELKPCPCGKTPTELHLIDANQGTKWAYAMGNCCNEWMIEFRTHYNALDSEECMELGIEAWNESPRARNELVSLDEVVDVIHSYFEQTQIVHRDWLVDALRNHFKQEGE